MVVPWRYDTTAYVRGKLIQFSEAEIVNIDGTRGMTRNGHVFTPKFTSKIALPIVTAPKEKIVSKTPSQ